MLHSDTARQVADFLLENQAVILRPSPPFRWAGGWLSPVYCDNRIILSDPAARDLIRDRFADAIKDKFPKADAIAGVATAGIPHAALAADKLRLPMAYVRAKPKDHGTQKLIEGRLLPGQRVVVIEDLISTGKSSLQAIDALKAEDIPVEGLLAVFTYGFAEAEQAFEKAEVPFYTLTDFPTLVARAIEKGYLKSEHRDILNDWRQNPAEWKG